MNTDHLAKVLHEMTELLDNWDDDGGKAVPKELTDCVGTFLAKMNDLAQNWKRQTPDPQISPGPKNTVDIHWKSKDFELLINVSNSEGLCSFYGERPEDSHVIRGMGYLSPTLSADLLRFLFDMPIE